MPTDEEKYYALQQAIERREMQEYRDSLDPMPLDKLREEKEKLKAKLPKSKAQQATESANDQLKRELDKKEAEVRLLRERLEKGA